MDCNSPPSKEGGGEVDLQVYVGTPNSVSSLGLAWPQPSTLNPATKNYPLMLNSTTRRVRNFLFFCYFCQKRATAQHERFKLPLYPTTTIGSFPQTVTIRNVRRGHNASINTKLFCTQHPWSKHRGVLSAVSCNHSPVFSFFQVGMLGAVT